MKRFDIGKGRYLVAVSGGPDSMALLDMCRKSGNHLEVGHVNYHMRDSAVSDERLVRRYCRQHGIRFHRLNVYPEETEGNFQQYARNVRYGYFERLCRKNDLDAVLVAHQRDDLIETYLMQKEKNIGVEWYGLKEDTIICGTRVIRPLLKWDKQELIDYCDRNGIMYGIDESNLTDKYARNRIRHRKVEKMTAEEKKELLEEIKKKNDLKTREERSIGRYLDRDSFSVDEFLNIENLETYLRHLFPRKSSRHYREMIRQISSARACMYREDDLYLVREYGEVHVFRKPEDYEVVFKSMEDVRYRKYAYFRTSRKGDGLHGVTLKETDFPVTIRNHRKGDAIRMRYGTKRISRFFIDRKIPCRERLSYPVVIDAKGDVVMVPGMGCDECHYSDNHNLYVIKL